MRKDFLKKLTTMIFVCLVGISAVHCDPPRLMDVSRGGEKKPAMRTRAADRDYLEDESAGAYMLARRPVRGRDDRMMVQYRPPEVSEDSGFQPEEHALGLRSDGDNFASVTKDLREGLDGIQSRLSDLQKIIGDATEKTSAQLDVSSVGEMRADLSQEKLKLELRNSQ